jgi:hypothetical protein
MTTNRKPIARNRTVRITPEVIAAYQRALKLHHDPRHCNHETYDFSREYYDACAEPHRLLGRDIGAEQVLHTLGVHSIREIPTELPYRPWDVESFKEALMIRLELESMCQLP